jgi:hypothetical protein
MIEDLGAEALRLQQHMQDAQQELADTQSCHAVQVAQLGDQHSCLLDSYLELQQELAATRSCNAVQVAQLNDQHSTLLESHIELQRRHNKMAKDYEDSKVRAQCACSKMLLLQRLYSTSAAVKMSLVPVLLLVQLLNCVASVLYMHGGPRATEYGTNTAVTRSLQLAAGCCCYESHAHCMRATSVNDE